MSLKMTGVSRDELMLLVTQNQFQPAFTDQSCYIANGPMHEILAVLQASGLFDVQLLDKRQAGVSVDETIRVFRQFAARVKTEQSH